MKNLHLLQTNKPSSLVLDTVNNNLFITTTKDFGTNIMQFQNIYIIHNEEIKEGDWFYNILSLKPEPLKACENGDGYVNCSKYSHYRIDCKKIILTTDEQLINGDVQAIDDDFLQWFVKNPSCEEVKFYKDWFQVNQNNPLLKGSTALVESYKIIIPQEKPKALTKLEISKNIAAIGIGKEKPKQEYLEQAALSLYPKFISDPYNPKEDLNKYEREIWIEGAKWQQEQQDDFIQKKYKQTLAFGEWLLSHDIVFIDNTDDGNIYDYNGVRFTMSELYQIFLIQNI